MGVLSLNDLKLYLKTLEGNVLVEPKKYSLNHSDLKKIMGFALNTIRKHGVSLNVWTHLEIDVNQSASEVDVHFMEGDKVKVNILGIETKYVDTKLQIGSFYCISVQPK